jgi:hypothetical protein
MFLAEAPRHASRLAGFNNGNRAATSQPANGLFTIIA